MQVLYSDIYVKGSSLIILLVLSESDSITFSLKSLMSGSSHAFATSSRAARARKYSFVRSSSPNTAACGDIQIKRQTSTSLRERYSQVQVHNLYFM